MYSCFKTLFNAGCLNILLLYLFSYLDMIKFMIWSIKKVSKYILLFAFRNKGLLLFVQWHRGEGEEKIMTNGDKAGEKNNRQNKS